MVGPSDLITVWGIFGYGYQCLLRVVSSKNQDEKEERTPDVVNHSSSQSVDPVMLL